MSTTVLTSTRPLPTLPPAHIAFASSPSTSALFFAVLYPDSFLEVYSWSLPLTGNAQKNALAGIPAPVLQYSLQIDPNVETPRSVARQCAIRLDGREGSPVVAVLRTSNEADEIFVVRGDDAERKIRRVYVLEPVGKLLSAQASRQMDDDDSAKAADFLVETLSGEILEGELVAFVDPVICSRMLTSRAVVGANDDTALPSSSLSPLPEFCPCVAHVYLPPPAGPLAAFRLPSVIGLSATGRLYTGSRPLASDATSFVITPDFVIYTTYSHEVRFVPLSTLGNGSGQVEHTESFARRAGGSAGTDSSSIKRAVERGSRIVTVVPSTTMLVLQMPRGNLETICPRPLVLRVVRAHLDK